MPPRPALQLKRELPGSAIYLDKNLSVTPNLQDLVQSSSAYPSFVAGESLLPSPSRAFIPALPLTRV